MLSLKPFKSAAPGVNDLLNWAAPIDAGIVQCKDGSLLAGWYYRGPDVDSATAGERNSLSFRVNAALTRLSGGWAMWVGAERTDAAGYPEPEASHFPDSISRLIDDERRDQFEAEGQHFDSDYAIVLQHIPPLRRNSKILDVIYDEDPAERQHPAERILAQFKKDLITIEDAIGDAVILRRMRSGTLTDDDGTEFLSDELVNYLHYCLNNEPGIGLKIPHSGGYLDTIIGLKALLPSDTPLYGDEYIAAVAISGFPEESFPQILGSLDSLELCYRWSTRFIFLEQHEAVTELKKYHRKWKQKVRGFFSQLFRTQGGTINEDALLMTQQAQSAVAVAEGGKANYGFHTAVVILRNRDRVILLDQASIVAKAISRLGFATRVEDFNAMEAWLGSLPGHPIPNVRRPPEHTENLSHMLPLTSVWSGSPVHPNPLYPPNSPPLFFAKTTGSTPFRCSLHYGDLGHVLVLGPPGSGKSTQLCAYAHSMLRYAGATVTALDSGRSLKTLCQGVGGLHYEIAGEGSPSFCLFGDLDTEVDRAETQDLAEIMFELQHQRAPLPHHKDAIHQALMLLSKGQDRSVTHFIAAVQDHEVRQAMVPYSLQGPMGHLYDAERDGLAVHHFIVHEISELMTLKAAATVPAILHIFRKHTRQLKGQPSMFIMDEAWLAFGMPLLTEKLREKLKAARKECTSVVLATHSLSDALRGGLFDVLVDSCPYKIYLPNAEAGIKGTATNPGPLDLYQALGRNEVEIDIIRYATPKRHAYVTCPEGKRLIEFGFGPAALAFFGVSDKAQLTRIEQLQRLYPEEWQYRWIDERQGRPFELAVAAE